MTEATARRRGVPLMPAFGVWVVARPSVLVLLALFALFWGDRETRFSGEALIDGTVRGLALLTSVLIHELAHGAAIRGSGGTVRSIELSFMGGRTTSTGAHRTPGRAFVVAAAGPAATIALAALCLGAVAVGVPREIESVVVWAAWINVALAALNLLPGLPFDGGVMAAALVWAATKDEARGTVVAAWAGRVFAVLVLLGTLGFAFAQGRAPEPIEYGIGALLFVALWMGATRALVGARMARKTQVVTAAAFMHRVVTVDHRAPAGEADAAAALATAAYVVVLSADGQPSGYYPAGPADAESNAGDLTAGDLAQPLARGAEVQAHDVGPDVAAALRKTLGSGDAVVVRDGGAIVGLVVARDFAEFG